MEQPLQQPSAWELLLIDTLTVNAVSMTKKLILRSEHGQATVEEHIAIQ